MFYVYVLRSIEFNRQYIGMSSDVDRRLAEHNKGKSKSTKPYKPWSLIFFESFETSLEAREREKWLKSGVGRKYIDNNWPRV